MLDFEQRSLTTALYRLSWASEWSMHRSLLHSGGDKGSLPFLDVHVKKDGSECFQEAHTHHYLHYYSHHHPKVKSGIADCLHHRAKWIWKQGSVPADERKHVKKDVMANGYLKQAVVKKKRVDGCWSGWLRARVCVGQWEVLQGMQASGCTNSLCFHVEIPSENFSQKWREDQAHCVLNPLVQNAQQRMLERLGGC